MFDANLKLIREMLTFPSKRNLRVLHPRPAFIDYFTQLSLKRIVLFSFLSLLIVVFVLPQHSLGRRPLDSG